MAFSSFRAAMPYQAIRPLNINASAVPSNNVSVESYSVAQANIASNGGSIADLTTDSSVNVEWANPKAASIVGLTIIGSTITATGEITLTTFNASGATITPAAGLQVNILVY